MKMQLFAGAALALAFSAPAFAQPSDTDWTGPYVGVDLGAGFTNNHVDELAPNVPVPPRGTGTENLAPVDPIGGGLVGYNWQFSNHLVLGLEGDFEGSGVHRTSHCLVEDNNAFNPAPGNCFP